MKEQKKLYEYRINEKLVEPIVGKLKRKYKDKLSELELLEVARKFIRINRILSTTIKNLEGIDATGLWFVFFCDLVKLLNSDKSKVSELYSEELVESVVNNKEIYKEVLPEPELQEVARNIIKIIKILMKTDIEPKKVDIIVLWFDFFKEFSEIMSTYLKK